jgi:hypothetical protein
MTQWRDDDEADLHDSELPEESDQDGDSLDQAVDLLPCPFCRKGVCEQADVCPHCGNFISFMDLPQRHFGWMIVGVVLCIAVLGGSLLYVCRW